MTPLSASLVKCFVCDVCNVIFSKRNKLRLVKVADDIHGSEECLKSTRLRYFGTSSFEIKLDYTVLPLFWNLQGLKFLDRRIKLPTGIWEMPQLRHLMALGSFYIDPPVTQMGSEDFVILENLQKLVVSKGRCSREMFERILNLKKLIFFYEKNLEYFGHANHQFHSFADLDKLEYLTCRSLNLEFMSFPSSLRILKLGDCRCPWERITVIGSLPNLERLLLEHTQGGPEWYPTEGAFLRLKTLSIQDSDLVRWTAEKCHFPEREILILEGMWSLEKIPSGIGEIDTLREIRLIRASKSVVQSAREIIEEQQDYGNEDLQLITR